MDYTPLELPDDPQLTTNITHFARALRVAGLPAGPGRVADAIRAVAVNNTAMVAVTLREGTRALDPKLTELAKVYRFGPWRTYRHVILPQLWPYLFASMRNGIAIIWKIVLVAEFLGRPNGVGFQIHLYFQLFETRYVLAYALSFVAVMLAIEFGIFSVWERRANAWSRQSA